MFITIMLINKSSSTCGLRNTELKPESLKLYNRTDKNNVLAAIEAPASRNNAYNSLSE